MAIDFKALAAKAVEKGVDMTQATTGGGGDYTPPAEGPTRVRLVGYIEVGKQKDEFQGKPRNRDKVQLIFELSGPKHPPIVGEDGTKYPIRITIEESLSLNEKANFKKLFDRMNYKGTAKHMAELLGEPFKAKVVHRKYAKKGEPKADPSKWTGVAAELRDKATGYTIEPPRYEVTGPDGPTGELAVLTVDPAISEIRCFLWEFADLEQWAGIYIDGKYDDRKDEKTGVITPGRSKNVFQNKIKLAVNFAGSPIHTLLVSGGEKIDLPSAEDGKNPDMPDEEEAPPAATSTTAETPTGQAADDVLNGVV